jgi:hypothetical protein
VDSVVPTSVLLSGDASAKLLWNATAIAKRTPAPLRPHGPGIRRSGEVPRAATVKANGATGMPIALIIAVVGPYAASLQGLLIAKARPIHRRPRRQGNDDGCSCCCSFASVKPGAVNPDGFGVDAAIPLRR